LSELVTSGRIVELILLLTVVEGLGLVWWYRRSGRGVAPREFLANLVSGCLLLLAMRAYVGSAWWGWVAGCLLLAGVAHSVDLLRRWR